VGAAEAETGAFGGLISRSMILMLIYGMATVSLMEGHWQMGLEHKAKSGTNDLVYISHNVANWKYIRNS
jgi:hypothetical protein